MEFPQWQREKWVDVPGNPLVGKDEINKPRAAIGDPQVLVPGEFDEKWHMFYHGFYGSDYTPFLHHLLSDDGLKWELSEKLQMNTNPLFIFHDSGMWYLYYSAVLGREPGAIEKYGCVNIIRVRRSTDLKNWSEDTDILLPELPWEKESDASQPGLIEVRNPCVVKVGDKFRLYYSAGTVKLHDCGYEEPKYIGVAFSDSPLGPFVKRPEPIIAPDNAVPYRNYGAGAVKVYSHGDGFLGLYNSIYIDANGNSRSAINLIKSGDGIIWHEAPFNPIVIPCDEDDRKPVTAETKWKRTLIYQLDLVRWRDELRLYYNAREGTADGTEKIGCSVIADKDTDIRKLWDLSTLD